MKVIALGEYLVKKYALPTVDIGVGEEGIDFTTQAPWKKTTECTNCGGEARLAVAFAEKIADKRDYIVESNPDDGGWWPHDLTAYAIYICKELDCARSPTTLFNQS